MSERREPTITPMSVDSREEQSRQRARPTSNNGTTTKSGTTANRHAPPPVSSRPVIVRSKSAPVALFLVLLVGAFAGYSFWMLFTTQQELKETTQQLQGAVGRVADLEKRLMMSDDESTQSLTVIQANVKENASEIRKLWGVAYDRNRKAIADLDDSVNKLQTSVKGMDEKVKKSTEDLAGEVRVLSELVDAQQAAISRIDNLSSGQRETLAELEKRVKVLDGDLHRRVTTNEEAIKAIDAFRLQINREILQLKGG